MNSNPVHRRPSWTRKSGRSATWLDRPGDHSKSKRSRSHLILQKTGLHVSQSRQNNPCQLPMCSQVSWATMQDLSLNGHWFQTTKENVWKWPKVESTERMTAGCMELGRTYLQVQKKVNDRWVLLMWPKSPFHCILLLGAEKTCLSVMVGELAGKNQKDSSLPRLMSPAKVSINTCSQALQALIDSEAEQSLLCSSRPSLRSLHGPWKL